LLGRSDRAGALDHAERLRREAPGDPALAEIDALLTK
jgi:hypothetical protein